MVVLRVLARSVESGLRTCCSMNRLLRLVLRPMRPGALLGRPGVRLPGVLCALRVPWVLVGKRHAVDSNAVDDASIEDVIGELFVHQFLRATAKLRSPN